MKKLVLFAALSLTACSPLTRLHREMLRPVDLDAKSAAYEEPPDLPRCKPVLERLEKQAVVSYVDASQVLWIGESQVIKGQRIISIDQRLNACGRLETLAHELGHFNVPYGVYINREIEIFVDAVSYLIARRTGIPTTTERYGLYLSAAKLGDRVLVVYRKEIRQVADRIWRGENTASTRLMEAEQ